LNLQKIPSTIFFFADFAKKSPKSTGFLNCFGRKIPFVIPSFEILKFASWTLLALLLSKTPKNPQNLPKNAFFGVPDR